MEEIRPAAATTTTVIILSTVIIYYEMMLITMMLTITKRRAKVQTTDIQNVENKIILKRSCNRFVGRQNSALHCTTVMGSDDFHALFLWRQIWTQGFHALFCVSVFLWRPIWTHGFHVFFPISLETNLDTRIPCFSLSLCSFGDQYGHKDYMTFSASLSLSRRKDSISPCSSRDKSGHKRIQCLPLPFIGKSGHKESIPFSFSLFVWKNKETNNKTKNKTHNNNNNNNNQKLCTGF